MSHITISAILVFIISVNAQEIAITIDDAPRADSRLFTGERRTQKLIENLKNAKVADVLFFVKTKNINDHSRKRLEAYIKAGFQLPEFFLADLTYGLVQYLAVPHPRKKWICL